MSKDVKWCPLDLNKMSDLKYLKAVTLLYGVKYFKKNLQGKKPTQRA